MQQFFEALGLAKPPKVTLKTAPLQLTGDPGQVLSASLEVSTLEKKHVFAFAISDKPWAIPGSQPKHNKTPTQVTLPLTIHVPGTPGVVQQARITITANGNQKFVVPIALSVSGKPGDYVPIQAILLPAETAAVGGAVPIMATPIQVPAAAWPQRGATNHVANRGAAAPAVAEVVEEARPSLFSAAPMAPWRRRFGLLGPTHNPKN